MNNQLTQMLMSQLKIKNPQMFNQIEEMVKSNGNPQVLLNQVMGGYTPEQTQKFIKFANSMGISNEQLSQVGINTK